MAEPGFQVQHMNHATSDILLVRGSPASWEIPHTLRASFSGTFYRLILRLGELYLHKIWGENRSIVGAPNLGIADFQTTAPSSKVKFMQNFATVNLKEWVNYLGPKEEQSLALQFGDLGSRRVALFRNLNASNATGVENHGQISYF